MGRSGSTISRRTFADALVSGPIGEGMLRWLAVATFLSCAAPACELDPVSDNTHLNSDVPFEIELRLREALEAPAAAGFLVQTDQVLIIDDPR